MKATLLVAAILQAGSPAPPARDGVPDVRLFFQAMSRDAAEAKSALDALGKSWHDGYAGMIVDLVRLFPQAPARRPSRAPEDAIGATDDDTPGGITPPSAGGGLGAPSFRPQDPRRGRLIRFLEQQTGQRFGDDLRAWRRWIWRRPYEPHPELAVFKAALYSNIDPKMGSFFAPGPAPAIRLDEVDWGGVKVNGIPPLDHPRVVPAAQARYLKGRNVVFGIVVNGEARAYPKRILAWHELALDRLGGQELAVVYCTLCGTVIPYGAEAGGRRFTLGTSGLLYRSNKLLFDHETSSLWSTIEGRPVIGPLTGSGLVLPAHPVVTTTWEEWVESHPATTVLSDETGFERDYAEGAAYREYFATDSLMFEVPRTDERLRNKEEVLTLVLRTPGSGAAEARHPLAISAQFLKRNPVHHLSLAGQELVVVTSPAGANRVYRIATGTRFTRLRPDQRLEDARGGSWLVAEDALVSESSAERAPRVPARRSFWFGWFAQYPDTELVR